MEYSYGCLLLPTVFGSDVGQAVAKGSTLGNLTKSTTQYLCYTAEGGEGMSTSTVLFFDMYIFSFGTRGAKWVVLSLLITSSKIYLGGTEHHKALIIWFNKIVYNVPHAI